jgi:hypothetical protein
MGGLQKGREREDTGRGELSQILPFIMRQVIDVSILEDMNSNSYFAPLSLTSFILLKEYAGCGSTSYNPSYLGVQTGGSRAEANFRQKLAKPYCKNQPSKHNKGIGL